MKLIFNLFLFLSFSFNTSAMDGILIYHQDNLETTKVLIKVLTKKFSFPENLISIIQTNTPCQLTTQAIMAFCIKSNDEVKILSIDNYFLKNNFKNFIKGNEDENV